MLKNAVVDAEIYKYLTTLLYNDIIGQRDKIAEIIRSKNVTVTTYEDDEEVVQAFGLGVTAEDFAYF